MLSREDNELLTRVGRGTPMGATMRRYWIPALLARELPEPDCPPVRVRLLGEDLVAFRDTQGRIGLVDELCPHRRASLFFGRNEECGLRCVYHGWKFDVDGRCVDMMNEPESTQLQGQDPHHRRIRRWSSAASSGPTSGPPSTRRPPPPVRLDPGAGDAPAGLQGDPGVATGCRASRAASTPRTRPSCTGCITTDSTRGPASSRRTRSCAARRR